MINNVKIKCWIIQSFHEGKWVSSFRFGSKPEAEEYSDFLKQRMGEKIRFAVMYENSQVSVVPEKQNRRRH